MYGMAQIFVPFPNVAQFNLCFSQYGQKMQNVYHLLNDSPFDQVSMALACQLFKGWYDDHLKSVQSSSVTFTRIIARALDNDTSPAIEFTNGLPTTGSVPGLAYASNVTVAVKWGTAYAGRSYRGRTYHIGLWNETVSGNAITADNLATLTAAYQALLTALNASPWKLCVASRYHNKQARTTGVATEVSSVSIEANVDSQRRRLNGRGE